MVARVALFSVAGIFFCLGTAFLGVGLYSALLLAMAPWAAGLLTGFIALVISGLFAIVGAHWKSSSNSALGSAGLGAAAASLSRVVETNPMVAIGAAALVGIVQAVMFGKRR
ncbi:hypothetical protein [Aquabacter cavernae]|uniref:hypothetical protein n=1 Tax=Aquabacter cavernae TaxID=2496029 RepID=UPI000F8EF430|nr:hypothetical protein [Aquabacter cavernae]